MTHVVGKLAPSSQRLKQLGQCASSPGHTGYCYAELTVSPIVVAVAITNTHCAYSQRDGQAELTWVPGYLLR